MFNIRPDYNSEDESSDMPAATNDIEDQNPKVVYTLAGLLALNAFLSILGMHSFRGS